MDEIGFTESLLALGPGSWPPAPCVPFIVGAIGHRDPAPGSVASIENGVRTALAGLRDFQPAPAIALATGLAEGADQIVANIALEYGIPLLAIAPMELGRYRQTFIDKDAGWQNFEALWRRASLRIVLPWTLPGPDAADAVDAQFEQLGLVLARYSHVLMALWDGDDGGAAPSPGGTAQIVAMRRHGGRTDAQASGRNSTLIAGALPLLELSPAGPLIQIVTPRVRTGGAMRVMATAPPSAGAAAPGAGEVYWWSDRKAAHNDAGAAAPRRAQHAGDIRASVGGEFATFTQANTDLRGICGKSAELCAQHTSFLWQHETANDGPLAALRRLQAHVDVVAGHYQRLVLGEWSPGLPWAEGVKLARRRGGRVPAVGLLTAFAVAIPLLVFFYEGYAHLHFGKWSLVAYLAVIATAFAAYYWGSLQQHWQERYQDYRALAEALRVQFYWSACGIPVAASDNYLRQHADALGWIRQALRGPALLGIAAAGEARAEDARRSALAHWVGDQVTFFKGTPAKIGKAGLNEQAQRRVDTLTKLSLIVSVAAAVLLLLLRLPAESALGDVLILLPGLAPAVAAMFVVFGEGRGYEAHAHTYERSARIYQRAGDVVENRKGDAKFRELVIELGQEALAENAAWLATHREHRIGVKQG